jgi:hypothetical protein
VGTIYTSSRTPLEVTQGTAHLWPVPAGDYNPGAGFTATLIIINTSGSLTVAGTASTETTDAFDFSLTVAETTALHAGSYNYQVTASDGTAAHVIEAGRILVLPNVAISQPLGVSGKSPAQQRYDHYIALVQNESFIKTMGPGGITEIEQIIRRLEWDLRREEDAEKARRGINTTRKLYTRFK